MRAIGGVCIPGAGRRRSTAVTLVVDARHYGLHVPTGPDARDVDVAAASSSRLGTPIWSGRSPPARTAPWRPPTTATGAPCTPSPRRAAGSDIAEELTQDVFVAAWSSAARFDRSRGSLAGWLLGIARHKVVDSLRRRERASTRLERAAALAGSAPASDLDRLAERLVVAEGLDQLPAQGPRGGCSWPSTPTSRTSRLPS